MANNEVTWCYELHIEHFKSKLSSRSVLHIRINLKYFFEPDGNTNYFRN